MCEIGAALTRLVKRLTLGVAKYFNTCRGKGHGGVPQVQPGSCARQVVFQIIADIVLETLIGFEAQFQ